jgi:hypothetical protein
MNVTRFMTAAAAAALLAGPVVAQTASQPATGQTGTTTTTTNTNTTTPTAPEDDTDTASTTVNAGTTAQNLGSTDTTAGGAMTSGVEVRVVANAPIPDTPENRARYGQPESNAGKRTIGEGPVGELRRAR